MDLNNIMSNIYGENAPQNFDSITLSGGRVIHKQSRVKYVDAGDEQTNSTSPSVLSPPEYSYRANKIYPELNNLFSSLSGGATSKTEGSEENSDIVYSTTHQIEKRKEEIEMFIREFYLDYVVANAFRNAIFVIPTKATMKDMIKELKDKLEKEKLDPYSVEAAKYVSKNDFMYKNYIFDIYGSDKQESGENDTYHTPAGYPKNTSETVLKRTNRLSKVYYFKFNTPGKVKVSANEKMTGAVALDFLGNANHSVVVLYGDLPPSAEGKKSNVITASMSGGNKRNYLRNYFMSLVSKYNNDFDYAAYHFIGAVGAACKNPSKLAKYYSGDYLHSAFSILSDAESFDVDEGVSSEDVADVHSEIIDSYMPKKSVIKMNKVNDVLPRILRNCKSCKTGLQASKTFISTLNQMYKTINAPPFMMKADVATALCKQGGDIQTVRNAFNLMDEITDLETDKSTSETNSMSGGYNMNRGSNYFNSSIMLSSRSITSPLVSTVYGAISSSPFIGSIAREYTPMLLSARSRRSGFKQNKAFEDDKHLDNEKEESLQFSILNDESNETTNTENVNNEPSGEDSDEDVNDIDIKSFF